MSYDLQFPRDVFYWGQNRLGSFLPLVAHPFVKLLPVAPLITISIVHYLLLLVSAWIISGYLKNKWLSICLFIAVFFPVSDYRALLFMGHPYSQQLFCGTLFIFFLVRFLKQLQSVSQHGNSKITGRTILLLSLAMLFYGLGIWISELGTILILIPAIYFLINYRYFVNQFGYKQLFLYILYIGLFITIALIIMKNLKRQFIQDALYEEAFFFDKERIDLQFGYLKTTLSNVIFFRDNRFLDNLFYYVMFPFIVILLFLKRDKETAEETRILNLSILITSVITAVLLFFSTWNLRSNFCSRYYIPVYYLLVISFLLAADRKSNASVKYIFSLFFIGYCTYYSVNYLKTNNGPGPLKRYSDFRKLPQGTLIAGYWDTYLIGSVANTNLIPLPWDERPGIRNWFHRKPGLENENFYFINNASLNQVYKDGYISQYNHRFIFTGKTYICNGIEVMLFKKADYKSPN